MPSVGILDTLGERASLLAGAIRDAGFQCRLIGEPFSWCAANPFGILVQIVNGVEHFVVVRQLRHEHPNVSQVCLIPDPSSDDYVRGFGSGADLVLDVFEPVRQVTFAIEAVNRGKILLDVAVIRKFVGPFADKPDVQLGDEELRILRLVSEGAKVSHIQRELHCSRRTAYRRIEGLCSRLGAQNPAQAAYLAGRYSLVDLADDLVVLRGDLAGGGGPAE